MAKKLTFQSRDFNPNPEQSCALNMVSEFKEKHNGLFWDSWYNNESFWKRATFADVGLPNIMAQGSDSYIRCQNAHQSNCPVNSNKHPIVNVYDYENYNCCKDYKVNYCCGPPKPKCFCCPPRDPPPKCEDLDHGCSKGIYFRFSLIHPFQFHFMWLGILMPWTDFQ